ncbi:hypothetical protein WICMUC_001350 [Wickerhamomyces mucosus]|uniref:Uncharacterized protein n=1 Tax=Wickerhamomyces mucosus TaxID=1378264 RepID=A0A9P8PX16_9ASCO|nr:hypothetical protein WICMUC_001350 [Wickerhamomyces mucosus]
MFGLPLKNAEQNIVCPDLTSESRRRVLRIHTISYTSATSTGIESYYSTTNSYGDSITTTTYIPETVPYEYTTTFTGTDGSSSTDIVSYYPTTDSDGNFATGTTSIPVSHSRISSSSESASDKVSSSSSFLASSFASSIPILSISSGVRWWNTTITQSLTSVGLTSSIDSGVRTRSGTFSHSDITGESKSTLITRTTVGGAASENTGITTSNQYSTLSDLESTIYHTSLNTQSSENSSATAVKTNPSANTFASIPSNSDETGNNSQQSTTTLAVNESTQLDATRVSSNPSNQLTSNPSSTFSTSVSSFGWTGSVAQSSVVLNSGESTSSLEPSQVISVYQGSAQILSAAGTVFGVLSSLSIFII